MHKIIAGACAGHRGDGSPGVSVFQAAGRSLRFLLLLLLAALAIRPDFALASDWRAWESFRQHYIQPDGRVAEHDANGRTTSEAQSYAMFFALVHNDRRQFDSLLRWTEDNLAAGKLSERLPGWLWSKGEDRDAGKDAADGNERYAWRLLDDNSASDADLWLAYTLLEAGRLWQMPRYTELGLAVLRQVREKEVVVLPDGTTILLPGQRGFRLSARTWRVNPSYFVPQHFALFSRADPYGPWQALSASLPAMLISCCSSGFAPDWLSYQRGFWGSGGWVVDPVRGDEGSYDAIRVYLWAGMMDADQPGRASLLAALPGMLRHLRERIFLPEKINTRSGKTSGRAPPGFAAAMLPYLEVQGEAQLLTRQLELLRASERDGLYGAGQHYYDQVLALFGLGYLERRYRFSACGYLVPAWSTSVRPDC